MQVSYLPWRGRPSFLVSAPGASPLSAVVTRTGGHLAALWDGTDEAAVNPLWQPHWVAGEPSESSCQPQTWGPEPEAGLLTNIVGSNLCLDRFGPPHPGENRPLHGEAGVVQWSRVAAASSDVAAFEASLPLAGLHVVRSIALKGNVLSLSTSVRQLAGSAAKHVEWCEHTSLGGVFLCDAVISADVDACREMPQTAGDQEPMHTPVTSALWVPRKSDPACGSVRTCRVTGGSWTATSLKLGRRLTATFDVEEFPWLCLWTEHRKRTHPPWAGVEETRGMELSTKPFPEGQPPSSRETTFLNRPTTCIVPPSSALTKTVYFCWERIA